MDHISIEVTNKKNETGTMSFKSISYRKLNDAWLAEDIIKKILSESSSKLRSLIMETENPIYLYEAIIIAERSVLEAGAVDFSIVLAMKNNSESFYVSTHKYTKPSILAPLCRHQIYRMFDRVMSEDKSIIGVE